MQQLPCWQPFLLMGLTWVVKDYIAGGRIEWLLLRESRQACRGGGERRKEESNGKRVVLYISPFCETQHGI